MPYGLTSPFVGFVEAMLRNVPGSVGAFGETAAAPEARPKVMKIATTRNAGTRIDGLARNVNRRISSLRSVVKAFTSLTRQPDQPDFRSATTAQPKSARRKGRVNPQPRRRRTPGTPRRIANDASQGSS